MHVVRRLLPALALLAAPLAIGCSKNAANKDQGSAPPPPPPVETTKAGACAGGGGEVGDPISAPFFPRVVKAGNADYCVDPQGAARTYGDKGKLTIDEVCTTAVDGECEVYKRYG